jgi:ceramide synthetase
MVQMGIHLFSLFELVFIIGKSYRKYHEFLLHHCVTIILILFSMMSNQIAAGVIIIIVHDASDIFSSFGRGYLETRFLHPVVMVGSFITMLFSWVYLRTVVYPFCILAQVWANSPLPDDHWFIINFEYKALLLMASVLVGMHAFWIYFILEFAFKKAKGGKVENTHEAATPGKKSK